MSQHFVMMSERDWLDRAKSVSDEEMASWNPPRRADWQERLYVRGKLKFKGSPRGCRTAVNAYLTEPYKILTASGELLLCNR